MSRSNAQTTCTNLLDDTVVTQLYAAHAARLRSWFGKLSQHNDKLDDMVQDVFLRLAMRLRDREREPVRDPVSLLYFMAGRVLTDQLRKRKTQNRFAPLDSAGPLADPEIPLEERLCKQESIRERHAIIEALPEDQRSVIQLQVSGLKPAQIADRLHLPIWIVRRRLQLAYRRCQRQLRALGLSNDESN
jgi:RNA polymerase sigma factor (sigma-70 family)